MHADEGYGQLPDTKSDGQVRAIGPSAARLTASQPIRNQCPYVFPGEVGDGHYTAAKGCLARLCAAAKIEDVTPHMLRHTFGSVAGDLGFSELIIAALLGHATRGVTQGYVHIAPNPPSREPVKRSPSYLKDREPLPAKSRLAAAQRSSLIDRWTIIGLLAVPSLSCSGEERYDVSRLIPVQPAIRWESIATCRLQENARS